MSSHPSSHTLEYVTARWVCLRVHVCQFICCEVEVSALLPLSRVHVSPVLVSASSVSDPKVRYGNFIAWDSQVSSLSKPGVGVLENQGGQESWLRTVTCAWWKLYLCDSGTWESRVHKGVHVWFQGNGLQCALAFQLYDWWNMTRWGDGLTARLLTVKPIFHWNSRRIGYGANSFRPRNELEGGGLPPCCIGPLVWLPAVTPIPFWWNEVRLMESLKKLASFYVTDYFSKTEQRLNAVVSHRTCTMHEVHPRRLGKQKTKREGVTWTGQDNRAATHSHRAGELVTQEHLSTAAALRSPCHLHDNHWLCPVLQTLTWFWLYSTVISKRRAKRSL